MYSRIVARTLKRTLAFTGAPSYHRLMPTYDFFIAGRWRNAYCFIENEYPGEKVEFHIDGDADEFMKRSEELAQDDPLIRKIFKLDMDAERAAENFLLVLPAGIAGHIEAGVAYGLGKKVTPSAS